MLVTEDKCKILLINRTGDGWDLPGTVPRNFRTWPAQSAPCHPRSFGSILYLDSRPKDRQYSCLLVSRVLCETPFHTQQEQVQVQARQTSDFLVVAAAAGHRRCPVLRHQDRRFVRFPTGNTWIDGQHPLLGGDGPLTVTGPACGMIMVTKNRGVICLSSPSGYHGF